VLGAEARAAPEVVGGVESVVGAELVCGVELGCDCVAALSREWLLMRCL
jgi:hypothetical protein